MRFATLVILLFLLVVIGHVLMAGTKDRFPWSVLISSNPDTLFAQEVVARFAWPGAAFVRLPMLAYEDVVYIRQAQATPTALGYLLEITIVVTSFRHHRRWLSLGALDVCRRGRGGCCSTGGCARPPSSDLGVCRRWSSGGW